MPWRIKINAVVEDAEGVEAKLRLLRSISANLGIVGPVISRTRGERRVYASRSSNRVSITQVYRTVQANPGIGRRALARLLYPGEAETPDGLVNAGMKTGVMIHKLAKAGRIRKAWTGGGVGYYAVAEDVAAEG